MKAEASADGLYILMLSLHGLVRGKALELGKDADTGGQIAYVVELCRALSERDGVARVDLITRQIFDSRISADYAEPEEVLSGKARIIRLPFGPKRYLRKETLWPHLNCCVDYVLRHVQHAGRRPDVIHAHYADAGYVGAELSGLLGVPLVFTGHSLGRVKRKALAERGLADAVMEEKYAIARRIEAEEEALFAADLVITSTRQEVDAQYASYDCYQQCRMVVIPPGTDIDRYQPPRNEVSGSPMAQELERFLTDPAKPMILALSRPDERKNLATLIRAYGKSEALKELANLVIIAGSRTAISEMEKGPRRVLTELLLLVDAFDLYGKVAYPKQHDPDDVPGIYRMAARSHGVFINPALTEPFGLTLIEAAASGLPVVATNDGGPKEIIANCGHGLLVDPLDEDAIARSLIEVLADRKQWHRYSAAGVKGAKTYYTWEGHAGKYLSEVWSLVSKRRQVAMRIKPAGHLMECDRALITDVDDTLLGDRRALRKLIGELTRHRAHCGFGVATGRVLESALKTLEEWEVPMPDVLITGVGSEICYGPHGLPDRGWADHIGYAWNREALAELASGIAGIRLQASSNQARYKLSYVVDPVTFPGRKFVLRQLRRANLKAHVIYSRNTYLDFLPLRASKGAAVRYLSEKWQIPLERILTAGDSGNDADMLLGRTLSVVVANHHPDLAYLKGYHRVYFASASHAGGLSEACAHYDFFNACAEPASVATDDRC